MSVSVIDACIHHTWSSPAEIIQYVSRGWQEYLNQSIHVPGGTGQPLPIVPLFPFHRPGGDKLPGSAPDDGPPGSSLDLVRRQVLDGAGIERAVLSHDHGMLTPLLPNPHMAREVVQAINRWSEERWLGQDDRLYGLALVPTQTPDDAVAEIERVAKNDRIVGILLSANGLGKPFGHPIYHPIHRAAAAHDLPLVIHIGGEAPAEAVTHTAGGGYLGTYAEYAIFRSQALMTHAVSMIVQGVFEKYPNLKVLLTGGGVAWLPSLLWRFDTEYRAYRREAPWIKRMPSEIFRDHFRLSTWPLDVAPESAQLIRAMETIGDVEDILVYGSGYPDWDTDTPSSIQDRIPEPWRERVYHRNASELFRWDDAGERSGPNGGSGAVGAME